MEAAETVRTCPPRGQPATETGIDIDWAKYPHFHPDRDKMLSCPCCGEVRLRPVTLDATEGARAIAKVPFVITSGYRCPAHDQWVHRNKPDYKGTSSHTLGKALDVAVESDHVRYRIVRAAVLVGFKRIGLGPDFVHLDTDTEKLQNIIWTYRSDPSVKVMETRYNLFKMLVFSQQSGRIVIGRSAFSIISSGEESLGLS